MADENHQTTQPPAATLSAGGEIIQPRAEAAAQAQADEKVATAAKEARTKLAGFWDKISPDKEKKTPPAAKSDETPKEPEKKADEPAPGEKGAKPEKKPRARKPEVDPMQQAEAIGREIGRELSRAQTQPAAAKVPDEPARELELPDEFKRHAAVFDEMARLEPTKYGKIRQDLEKYAKAESDYIAKWEEDHQGMVYDGEDPEHNAFYEKVRVEFDQGDFDAAKESLIVERATRQAEERYRQRETETEKRRETVSRIQPEIDQEMFSILGEMATEADPKMAERVKNREWVNKIEEENPLLGDALLHVHNETKPVLEATVRLFRQIDQFDGRNPAHQRVAAMVSESEREVAKLPVSERYDNEGRLFATQDDYAKMSAAERARHWYIGENELLALIRGRAVGQTKSIYERERKRIERYTRGAPASGSTQTPATTKPAEAPQPKPDTSSPSFTGRSALPGDGKSGSVGPQSGKDLFFSKLISA